MPAGLCLSTMSFNVADISGLSFMVVFLTDVLGLQRIITRDLFKNTGTLIPPQLVHSLLPGNVGGELSGGTYSSNMPTSPIPQPYFQVNRGSSGISSLLAKTPGFSTVVTLAFYLALIRAIFEVRLKELSW